MKKFITFTWACTIALILAGMCEMSSFDNGIQKYSYVKNVKAETVKNHEKNQSIILNAPTVKVKNKTEKQVKIKWNRVKKANRKKYTELQQRVELIVFLHQQLPEITWIQIQ